MEKLIKIKLIVNICNSMK